MSREMVQDLSKHILPAVECFQYDALDDRPNRFRLLRLLPKQHDHVIRCELYQSLISKDTSYEALSYHWGSDERVEVIIINDETFRITDKLYAALQHLVRPGKDRVLWIDGICIDQSNNDEKSLQVQRMSSIYSKAYSVLIWLGKATTEVEILMHCLGQLESELLALHEPYTVDNARVLWSDLHKTHDLREQAKTGLQTLLRRSWFSRVWILQEVANARHGFVCAGHAYISASIFALAPSLIEVYDTNASYWKTVIALMPGLPRENAQWARRPELYDLVLDTIDSCATDARDKIFALLGLSGNAQDRKSIIVDYDQPLHGVYQGVLQYLARSKKSSMEDLLTIAHRVPGVGTVIVLVEDLRETQMPVPPVYWMHVPLEGDSHRHHPELKTIDIAKRNVHVFTQQLPFDSGPLSRSDGLYSELLRMRELTHRDGAPKVIGWDDQEGNITDIKLLFLDKSNAFRRSMLFTYAAANGLTNLLQLVLNLDVVQLRDLILPPADSNQAPCDALLQTSWRGDEAMVMRLLDMGFDPNGPAKDIEGTTSNSPLSLAVESGHHGIARLLVDRGADISRPYLVCNDLTQTPIILALARGQCSMAEFMLTKRTTYIPFHDESTPHSIHCLASLQMALDHGVSPKIILIVALLNFGFGLALIPIIELAFQKGADANAAFEDHYHLFGHRRSHPDLQYILSPWQRSQIPFRKGPQGSSMLQLAILSGDRSDPSAKIEALVRNGADINLFRQTETLKTALHTAVSIGCLRCTGYLLDHGAVIDQRAYGIIERSPKPNSHRQRLKDLLDESRHCSPPVKDDDNSFRERVEAKLPLLDHDHSFDDRDQYEEVNEYRLNQGGRDPDESQADGRAERLDEATDENKKLVDSYWPDLAADFMRLFGESMS